MSSQPRTAPETPTQPTWWQAFGGQPAPKPELHQGRVRMPGARIKQDARFSALPLLLVVILQFNSVIAAWGAVSWMAVGVWQAWWVRHAALDLAWREVGQGETDAGEDVLVLQLDGGLQAAVRVKVADLASVHLTGPRNQRVLRLGLRNGHAVMQPLQAYFLRRETDLEPVVQAWLLGLRQPHPPHAETEEHEPLFLLQTTTSTLERELQANGAFVPLVVEPAEESLPKKARGFMRGSSQGVFQQADGIYTHWPRAGQALPLWRGEVDSPRSTCWLALWMLVFALYLPWFQTHGLAFWLFIAVLALGMYLMNRGQFASDWYQPEALPLLTLKGGVLTLALSEREPPVQVDLSQVAQVSLVAVPARVPSARWRIRVNLTSGEVVEQVINANGVLPGQVARTWIVPQLHALLGHQRVQVPDAWAQSLHKA